MQWFDTKTPSSEVPTTKTPSFWGETIRFALIAILFVLPIRIFVAQPFVVSGSSMDPTFMNGQYLIVDEISYRFEEPKRGEVIIFKYPKDPSKFFIKRVIGLPGETLTIHDSLVTVTNAEHPEGFTLDESFIEDSTAGGITITLADDEYFVMGDNREASSDSRIWGALKRDLIVGRAFLRLLPPTRASIFPGAHTYSLPADTY